jgi:hypothetical protein
VLLLGLPAALLLPGLLNIVAARKVKKEPLEKSVI